MTTNPSDAMHVWTSPPETTIPDRRSPTRVAVGFPHGVSGNSWKIWVKGLDTYVACRDNFKEFKVSLHASGVWRVGLTGEAIRARPELRGPTGDRVIHRRSPNLADSRLPAIGFQVIVLSDGLYLKASDRRKWPKTVNFIEPPPDDGQMTVLSATVVHSHEPLIMRRGTRAAVIAMQPLGPDRTVQLVATYQEDTGVKALVSNAFERSANAHPADLPPTAVFFVYGHREDEIPWVTAVPYSSLGRP